MSVPTKFYLFRRNNGIYYIGYFEEGRKRWKSTGCTTKADALNAFSGFRERLSTKPVNTLLSVFISEFLAHAQATYSKGTAELYRWALGDFLTVTGDTALTSLTPQHADRFKAARLSQVSPVSVNVALRTLRAAMNTAVRWRLLESNPFKGLRPAHVVDKLPCYLTEADLHQLLGLISENWLKELVIFAVSTGLRQGEMLNLRWTDLDLDRKLLHIQSNGSFHAKQGRRRTIPMNGTAFNLLVHKAKGLSGDPVFARRGLKIGKSYLQHRFKHYVRQAGLPEGLHWHSLRHTHASWLVQAGVSLYEVQKLLGHSSSKVTEIYSHLQPEQLHDTVNKISVSMI